MCATPRPGAAAPPTNQSVTKSSNWFLGLTLGGAAQLKKRKGPAKAASSPGTLFRSQGRCACSTRATTASGSAHRRAAGAPTACWAGSGLETVGAGAGRCEGDWGCMVGPQSGSGGTFLAHLLAPASWFSHRGGMGIGAHPASRVVSSAAIAQRSVCPAACRPSAVPSTPVRGAFLAQSRVTGTGPRCSGKQKALAEWRLSFPYTRCCHRRTAHLSPGRRLDGGLKSPRRAACRRKRRQDVASFRTLEAGTGVLRLMYPLQPHWIGPLHPRGHPPGPAEVGGMSAGYAGARGVARPRTQKPPSCAFQFLTGRASVLLSGKTKFKIQRQALPSCGRVSAFRCGRRAIGVERRLAAPPGRERSCGAQCGPRG